MRKKIIIGIAASLFAVAGLFGVNTMNQNANSDISLSSIAVMAQAQAESSTSRAREAYCQIIGDRTGCKNDPTRTCGSTIFCN